MCSVLVNEWAFYGPYTTLPLYMRKWGALKNLSNVVFGQIEGRRLRTILLVLRA